MATYAPTMPELRVRTSWTDASTHRRGRRRNRETRYKVPLIQNIHGITIDIVNRDRDHKATVTYRHIQIFHTYKVRQDLSLGQGRGGGD